jgi:T5SS/PEP-CTERM-associated repeat protein
MVVSNGASVLMGGSSAGFAMNQIGQMTNSSGNSLVVTDSGSSWGGRGDLEIGVRGSSNFVSVLNGGVISNGTVRIGASNSSSGNYLLVDGAGSVFTNRIGMTVGNGTNTGNRVTVTNGGVLHAGNTLDIRSNSTVTADGSLWVGRNRPAAQAINVLHSGVTSTSTLTVNGTLTAQGNVTIGNLGLLGGAGTITASNTTIASGGRLSPGNSPGTLTVDGDMTWLGGGNYNWQIHNATGLVGTGWDYLSVTGTLDLSALTPSSKFNINLWSLSAVSPDTNGAAINFDNTLDGQSWDILVAVGGITGFDASDFNINVGATNGTTGFANALGGGSFGIEQQGNVISLTYTVPEPSTYALLALTAGAAGYVRWRRRRSAAKNS